MRLAVLLALTSVAAADPLAKHGDGSFEVAAGPGAFVTDHSGTSADPALAMRLSVGDYVRDDLALSIVFADTAYLHASGSSSELDNASTLALAAQLWVRRDVFVEGGAGLTYGSTPGAYSVSEESGYAFVGRAGWALPVRPGTAITLSAALTHTWLLGGPGSTDTLAAVVGYQFL